MTSSPDTNAVDPFSATPEPETEAVRAGENLDWDAIEQHLRTTLPSEVTAAGEFGVRQFPNGSANLTYLIAFGNHELVLRRPPFGTIAPGAHNMRREYKVLSRLWRTFDKAPRAYVLCEDHDVADADFFVMERRRGEVIRGVIPPSMREHDRVGHRVGLALVDAMAEFHLLDPDAAGLSDLGRPDGFMARQVAGWKKRWELVADPAYDQAMAALHADLASTLPEPQRVSLVHNDIKLDNCMFAAADPDRVTAFFDWDMTTLGDPLADLGTLLNYWPDVADGDADRSSHDGMAAMGLPSRSEVIERYGQRTGLDVGRASWYDAFAQWKTGVVVQQLHQRWKMGDSSNDRHATVAERLPLLIDSAQQLLR